MEMTVSCDDERIELNSSEPEGILKAGEGRMSWKLTARDDGRIQSIGFYYKNIRLDFPGGLEGVRTETDDFYVGGQKVHKIIFHFDEYYSERVLEGYASLDRSETTVLPSGSFYHIKAIDLDAPRNQASAPLSLTVE